MPYVVAQPCVDVKDKACVDECPVDCIYEGSPFPVYQSERMRGLRCMRTGVPDRSHLL